MKLERSAAALNPPSRAEGQDAGEQPDQRGGCGPSVGNSRGTDDSPADR